MWSLINKILSIFLRNDEDISIEKIKDIEMEKFDKVMKFVLQWEGGLVDHEADPGGLTNFGIAQRSHPDVDIRNLTEEGAKKIYKKEYWDKIKGDQLPATIALAVMDYAVNSGLSVSSRALQREVGAKADGLIGPATLSKVREQKDILKTAQNIVLRRVDLLANLVVRKPKMSVFLKGWMRRTHSCLIEINSII